MPRQDAKEKGRRLLVSNDHIMVLQETCDILYENRRGFFGFDIIRLCVAKIEKVDKRFCDSCFT